MTQAFAEVLNGSGWLMEPKAMRALLLRATSVSPQEIETARAAVAAMSDHHTAQPQIMGDVAVIPMTGPIVYKMSWFAWLFGCSCIEMMQQQFRMALADPAVKTILFRCDTPGGVVDMVPEFADEMFAARGTKPILCVADPMIASAGYWLAAQADTIYAPRSAQIGSIGTYTEHEDISGMLERLGVKITLIAHPAAKVEGNPYEPLSDAARTELQAWVDEVGAEFEAAVARGRGVPKSTVVEWTALSVPPRGKRAISLGLADKMGTFGQVMARLTKGRSGGMTMAATSSLTMSAQYEAEADTVTVDNPTGQEQDITRLEVVGDQAIVETKADDDEMPEMMDPQEDGTCPEGYDKGKDGMCHRAKTSKAQAAGIDCAASDALGVAIATES